MFDRQKKPLNCGRAEGREKQPKKQIDFVFVLEEKCRRREASEDMKSKMKDRSRILEDTRF